MPTYKKITVYFAGGSMTGVFGAGVASALEENNIYPHLGSVYGASAGVMSGAYLLSRQTRIGSTIYWENLQEGFISVPDFFLGMWQRFQNKFIKEVPWNDFRDAYNIDYLMEIAQKEKQLDVKAIISQPVPFYVKLYNLDKEQIEYLDAREKGVIKMLKAAMNAFPYVHEVAHINGGRYIDGAIMDIIGLDKLLELVPNDEIVIVLNKPPETKLRYKLKNMTEGKFMEWMFNKPEFYELFKETENRLGKDVRKAKEDPRVHLLAPPRTVQTRSRTTNSKKLLETWRHGFNEGQRLIKKLGLSDTTHRRFN